MLTRLQDGRSLVIFSMKPGDVLALDVARKGELVWRNGHAKPGATGAPHRGPIWGAALDDRYAYVPCPTGGIAAVTLAEGQQKWCAHLDTGPDRKVAYTAAVTVIPGVLIAGGSDGSLWALSTDDGHTLWKYQTATAFPTVNGVPAHGGSIVSAGATVAGGMVFVGSGYGVVAETPGNVLLAFSAQ
jgi:polyvinyl alcohol dehydrogenase (cytochrome)